MKAGPPPPIMAAIAAMLQPYGINTQQLLQEDTEKNNGHEQKWYSPREIEEKFSIGRWSVYRLIRCGMLQSAKLSSAKSGKVLVDAESLKQYLASRMFIPEKKNSVTTNKGGN